MLKASLTGANAERNDSNNERNLLLGVVARYPFAGSQRALALRELLTDDLSCFRSSQLTQLYAIEQSLEEQNSLISRPLDFARHQKGAAFRQQAVASIHDLLEQIISIYSHSANAKGLKISVDHIDHIVFQFDPKHFKRICSNLLSNAIKYTNEGQIAIAWVNCGVCELTFADTGIGIPVGESSRLLRNLAGCLMPSTIRGRAWGWRCAKDSGKIKRS